MTPGFSGVCVAPSVFFSVLFCRSLIFLLSFFCLPLYYLFFFDLLVLVIPLVSSNFSLCVVLDDSFFHSLFLSYHSKRTPSFLQSKNLPLYFIICLLFSSWLLIHNCSGFIKHQSMHMNSFKGFIDQQLQLMMIVFNCR